MNPALVEAAITPCTRALLPVDLFGYPCDMDALLETAQRLCLVVIEDTTQAFDADYKGEPFGSCGTGVLYGGSPTLALSAPDTAAAAIVQDTGAGEIVASDDPQAIAGALASFHERWKSNDTVRPSADIGRFERREIGRQMAKVFRRAIGQRGRL